jgi:hypothetical protein
MAFVINTRFSPSVSTLLDCQLAKEFTENLCGPFFAHGIKPDLALA